MSWLLLAVSVSLVGVGAWRFAARRARRALSEPPEWYRMTLPEGWVAVSPNRRWNHLKVRAPQGYGAVTVAAWDSFWPDDHSARRFTDAAAFFAATGAEALARRWKEQEEADGRAVCAVHAVVSRQLDLEPAIEVRYSLTVKAAQQTIGIRSVHALHAGRWFAFQFAASEADDARLAPELTRCEASIRWT